MRHTCGAEPCWKQIAAGILDVNDQVGACLRKNLEVSSLYIYQDAGRDFLVFADRQSQFYLEF